LHRRWWHSTGRATLTPWLQRLSTQGVGSTINSDIIGGVWGIITLHFE